MIGAFVFRVRTGDKNIIRQGVADIVVFVVAAVLILLGILTLTR
jgi:hypothetical protein